MILTCILFALGFPALIGGALLLVRGAGSVALKLGMSELAVGLTIVALGTSAPELIIALVSAFRGAADLAVANVIGSNTANILLILGVAAMIRPLSMRKTLRWREIPFILLSILVLAAMANDRLLAGRPTQSGCPIASLLSRGDGLVLLGFFAIYMYYVFSVAGQKDEEVVEKVQTVPALLSVLMILGGAAGLAAGGQWIVNGARTIAQNAGMSEAMIGLTIIAVGTSLPELAASAVAARQGNADLAIGNVVGSNILNVLWILGLTASITPVGFNVLLNTDIWILCGVTLLFFLFTWTGGPHKIDRAEGAILLVLYVSYVVFIVLRG
jgi:cation:H+ antiporter